MCLQDKSKSMTGAIFFVISGPDAKPPCASYPSSVTASPTSGGDIYALTQYQDFQNEEEHKS